MGKTAKRIKQKRIEKGLSQTDLAKLTGYADKTCISKLETADRGIRIENLKKIAQALGTTCAYLIGETDDEGLPEPVERIADGETIQINITIEIKRKEKEQCQ